MSADTQKIEQIGTALNAKPQKLSAEIISLALSIKDFEDRDLALLQIVEFLADSADWNRAFGVAQFIEGGYERTQALHKIAVKMAAGGYLERAFFVFSEAENAAKNVDSLWQRAELLHEIAKSLSAIGATHKAGEVWEKAISAAQNGESSMNPQEFSDAASVLSEITEYLASVGKIEWAKSVAESIKHDFRRERTLKNVAVLAEQIRQAA